MLRYIEKTLYKNYKDEKAFLVDKVKLVGRVNYFWIWMLIVSLIFHGMAFDENPMRVAGDVFGLVVILISFYVLFKGYPIAAGNLTLSGMMVTQFIQNVIGDYLYSPESPDFRFLETIVLLIFVYSVSLIFISRMRQLVIYIAIAALILGGHYYVLTTYNDMILSSNYLIYLLVPIIYGSLGLINLDQINKIIRHLVLSKEKIEHWNDNLERIIQGRTSYLQQANEVLEKLSYTDPLTTLGNRRKFDEETEKMWQKARVSETDFAVALIDIDYFKSFNDHYGFAKGDTCLQLIGVTLMSHFKETDALLARYSSNVFAVAIHEKAIWDISIALRALQSDLNALAIEHEYQPAGTFVTVSMGVASADFGTDKTVEELINKADTALHRAKEEGRNRVVVA